MPYIGRKKGEYEKALEAYDTFFHTDYAKINSSLYKETMMNKANLLVKMGRKEEAYTQYGAVFSYIKSSFEKNYPKEIDQLTTHFRADQLTYQNEQDRLFSYRFYLGGIIICTIALFLFLYFSWKKNIPFEGVEAFTGMYDTEGRTGYKKRKICFSPI